MIIAPGAAISRNSCFLVVSWWWCMYLLLETMEIATDKLTMAREHALHQSSATLAPVFVNN